MTLVIAVFAIGSATRMGQAAVAAAAAVALIPLLFSLRRFERVPPLVVLLLGASAWTAIQLIPLPAGIVATLSPTLAELRSDGALAAGVSVRTCLSMDPPATLRALTFLLTLSGVAIVALRVSISERGRYALIATISVVLGAAAIVTGLHELVGATSLYGLYVPQHGGPLVMGPMLNTNHLGCLMAVGVVTSFGLLVYPKQTSLRRTLWASCGLVCTAVTVATLSRGAVLGLAIGLVVAMFGFVVQRLQASKKSRRRRERLLINTIPIGIVVACGLVVAVYLGAGSVMHQLETTSLSEVHAPTSKFAAWKSSFTLIDEAPWVGVGRGAFESAFTRVHPASAFTTFSNPENEGLQALVEWGVPATLLLGIGAIWMMLLALRRWNDGPLAAGALGAIVVVVFQSNFDFGMELLGLAVPVIMLLSTLTYVPVLEMKKPHVLRARAARALHILVILGGGVALLTPSTRLVDEAHIALRGEHSTDVIRDEIANHPLDYFGFATLAEVALRQNDPAAVKLLNHALRLHPTHAGLHRIAARLLVRAGRPEQAEVEYSLALRYSRDIAPTIRELVTTFDVQRAARTLPSTLDLEATVRALDQAGKPPIAILWLTRVFGETHSARSGEALYSLAMREKDYAAAEVALREPCRRVPSTRCHLEVAQIMNLAGRPAEVVIELQDVEQWTGRSDERLQAWLMLCDAHLATGAPAKARECLRRVDLSGLVKPGDPSIQQRRDAIPRDQLDSGSATRIPRASHTYKHRKPAAFTRPAREVRMLATER